MAKPPGLCIFCKRGGLTKEHVFAEWLKEHFPRDASSTHTFGTFDWSQTSSTGAPAHASRKRQGHGGTKKVRVVCKACNGGWMSALENDTKPHLYPLIRGQACVITPDAQKQLATWAAKTVMAAEFVSPPKRGTSQQERSWLKENQIPPHTWYVWMSCYIGTAWRNLGIYQHRGLLHIATVGSPRVVAHQIHATTFGMGHVLFLVVGTATEHIHGFVEGIDGPQLARIWPPLPRTLAWPPGPSIGDPQANAIANFLTLSGAFNNSLNPGAKWTFAV